MGDLDEWGEVADLLEQEEKDMLSESQDSSGMDAVIDSSVVSYDRLPMLEVVFERLMRLLSTSLRNLTSEVVEITMEDMYSIRFGEYLKRIESPALVSVFSIKEWENSAILSITQPLAYALIDAMLGCRKSEEEEVETHPYTSIEQNLLRRFVDTILLDLSESFEPIEPVNFVFERMETNPNFAVIVMPNNASIICRLRLNIGSRKGTFDILIPYASLEPAREKLLQSFMGEKFGEDSIWETHLGREVWGTHMETEAILDQVDLKLSETLKWKVGTQLELDADEDSNVRIVCGERTLLTGKLGTHQGQISVQVEENFIKKRSNNT